MGEYFFNFWRWLQNAAQQAAIAEAPAVMTAAGQKVNRNTGKVEYNHQNDEGVKQLRSNLAAIGEAGANSPGTVEAVELGYNAVRHPQQTYRAAKRTYRAAKSLIQPVRKKIIKALKSKSQVNVHNAPQLETPPQEIDIDIPDIQSPQSPRWSGELMQALDDVGYRQHYIINPFESEEEVWRRVRELQRGAQQIRLRQKTPIELSERDIAIQKAMADAGPNSTYSLAYFNMSPRQAYEAAMQDWQNIPVGSSFALINDGALSTDSAPMVYGMMSRFGDEAELVPVMTSTGKQVMQTLNGLGRTTGASAIKRINAKIDLLNKTRRLNLPYSAVDPTSGTIMIPSVYGKRIIPSIKNIQ